MDAVIVLGAAVWRGGVPSPALERRARHGAGLVLAGRAPVLIASGGVGRYPPSEASLIARIALEVGVEPERIVLEERSTSTFESAVHCAEILRRRGGSRALVVSDRFHLPRSLLLFRSVGVRAAVSAADRFGRGDAGGRRLRAWLREALALPWSALRVAAWRWRTRRSRNQGSMRPTARS